MKLNNRFFLTAFFVFVSSAAFGNTTKFIFNLWGNGTNGSDVPDTAKVYAFLPDKENNTGRAVIICPGGDYASLNLQHEGTDWADFFNGQGISVFVLKYRMPNGNKNIPIQDAIETIKFVRKNAGKWNISTDEIGIMGASAGGHLASIVATTAKDEAAPNFQILLYPIITMNAGFTDRTAHDNLLGEKPRKKIEQEFSSDRLVSRITPRAFIALSDDDQTVLPANGVNYYFACYRHDVPASLHVYPKGGHGWGLKRSFPYHIEMLLDLKAWLNSF